VTLTAAGWPRPRDDWRNGARLPVPWIVSPPEWAKMDPERGAASLEDRLCQVCGEGHAEPSGGQPPRVVIFQDGRLRDRDTGGELNLSERGEANLAQFLHMSVILCARDQAMLHERCARLAVGTCPFLRGSLERGTLFAFTVPVTDLQIDRAFDREDATRLFALGERAEVWEP